MGLGGNCLARKLEVIFFLFDFLKLKLQAQEAESTRRGLERARQEIVRQVTVISAEKDYLEREVSLNFFFIHLGF